jgi:hypothetical protein
MIDQLAQEALKRINEYINRAIGQHLRALKKGQA